MAKIEHKADRALEQAEKIVEQVKEKKKVIELEEKTN